MQRDKPTAVIRLLRAGTHAQRRIHVAVDVMSSTWMHLLWDHLVKCQFCRFVGTSHLPGTSTVCFAAEGETFGGLHLYQACSLPWIQADISSARPTAIAARASSCGSSASRSNHLAATRSPSDGDVNRLTRQRVLPPSELTFDSLASPDHETIKTWARGDNFETDRLQSPGLSTCKTSGVDVQDHIKKFQKNLDGEERT